MVDSWNEISHLVRDQPISRKEISLFAFIPETLDHSLLFLLFLYSISFLFFIV